MPKIICEWMSFIDHVTEYCYFYCYSLCLKKFNLNFKTTKKEQLCFNLYCYKQNIIKMFCHTCIYFRTFDIIWNTLMSNLQ